VNMVKTLVCILSETRSHEHSWKSFKRFVLDALDADLALCIGVPEDYDFSNPYWQFAKYKFTVREFDDWGDAFDLAKHNLTKQIDSSERHEADNNWRVLLDVPDQWLGGVKGPNQHAGSAGILIAMRYFLLKSIIDNELLEKYERFVITRSDFVWKAPHPNPEILDPESVWIPDGEGYGGVTDRHAVLSRSNLISYLNLMERIIRFPGELKAEMLPMSKRWNLERFIRFCLNKSEVSVRYFPYFMYAVRSWGGSTRWSKGTWSDELGYYIKYSSEYLSANVVPEVVASQKDWAQIITIKDELSDENRVPSCGINVFLKDQEGRVAGQVGGTLKMIGSPEIAVRHLVLTYKNFEGTLYSCPPTLGDNDVKNLGRVGVLFTTSGQCRIQHENGQYLGASQDGILRLHVEFDAASLFNICKRY
jgi:hypothetical protein